MPTVISIENISKSYRLGTIGSGTLREDLQSWWHRKRGLPDPNLRVDQAHLAIEGHTLWALQNVSLEVEQGEVLGIIGRNGAGKSTLLKILSRVTAPTSGHIRVKGRVASLLEVGTGFHPELTGRENVFLNGAILGMTKAEVLRKFDEIVAFSEIEQFIDTPVKRYSSGMYVRLAFAVAAHLDPEILVVDEVLAVGDADFQKKCLGKMGAVADEGRTVIFVSHNMTAVRDLCASAICLERGQIVDQGEPTTVVDQYLQRGAMFEMDRTWDNPRTAPGNDKVRLCSARIVQDLPTPGKLITIETPLCLHVEVWNQMADANIHFTVHLSTVLGMGVFSVASQARRRPRGLIRVSMKIPGHFLNDGIYRLALQVVCDGSQTMYLHKDLLGFEVHDIEREGFWHGKWPGVVRPEMEWHTEDVGLAGLAECPASKRWVEGMA